jgi:hypothetical protein
MKKILFAAVLAGVGYVLYRAYAEERDERDLWTEVTDEVD